MPPLHPRSARFGFKLLERKGHTAGLERGLHKSGVAVLQVHERTNADFETLKIDTTRRQSFLRGFYVFMFRIFVFIPLQFDDLI